LKNNKILVICDDLTGTGDIAYWTLNSGLTQKIFDFENFSKIALKDLAKINISIINTESRFDNKEIAQKKIESISSWAKDKNFNIIFKKIDSTLRGNFVAEIDVLIKNFDAKFLPFCSAYPDYGRKTVAGFQYINDSLIHTTSFAKDPKNPVTESHIPTLIKNQSKIYKNLEIYKIYDVSKNEDFENVFKNITSHYKSCDDLKVKIFAGTAKFFSCLLSNFIQLEQSSKTLKYLKSSKSSKKFQNLLIISGSFNPVTKKQLDNFYTEFSLKELETTTEYTERTNIAKNLFAIESFRDFNSNYSLDSLIEKSKQLLKNLNHEETLIVLTGGDTAYKFCKYMQILDIDVLSKISTGIVLCKDINQKFFFILKPGGFGADDFLISLTKKIK
jgi:uncharacterized protein YgbK (DUF1537 family)